MANDGRLIAHLHQLPALLDLVDDEWRADHLGHGAPPQGKIASSQKCPPVHLLTLLPHD